MELYSMPQLDKSSYSDIHYVERSNLPNPSIPVDVKKFSPVSGDILTSSAWSAVIHRPAEDSEPEDLPSTVDMDAIKGSPTTSGALGDQGQAGGDDSESGDDEDDDDEEDDDENDKEDSSSDNESSSPNSDGDDADSESGTAHGSASDSDSESSSRNSCDSDSDSASSDSSCSSRSSETSHSSSSPTPVREPEKHSSSQEHQHNISGVKSRSVVHRNEKSEEKGDNGACRSSIKDEEKMDERRAILKKDDEKQYRKESLHSLHFKDEKRDPLRIPYRVKGDSDKPRESPSRGFRLKDAESQAARAVNRIKGSCDEVSSSRPGTISTSSSSAPRSFKEKSTEEKKSDHKASASITSSSTAVSSAVNDSSSEVELPDQVVNDAIKRIQIDSKSKQGPSTADLDDEDEDEDEDEGDEDEDEESSDDGARRRAHYSSSLLQKFVESTERLSAKHSSGQAHGSSTKRSLPSGGSNAQKETARYRHPSQLPSTSVMPGRPVEGSTAHHRGGPADLEVYCSVSNVSPDSGIYCVNGSPWHQSSPAHSPQHPQHLLKGRPSPPRGNTSQDQRRKHMSLKVAPASSSKSSSPKKGLSHQERHKDVRVPPILSIDDSDDETSSSSMLIPAPARRGRGRPRKTPPVLEPNLPFKSSTKRTHVSDRGQVKNRRPVHKKESESSDQSVERCDKILTYSKHRSREVQVTSQGVQCDQSEFPQFRQIDSKKKKKNQACQSYQVGEVKSVNVFKPSSHGGQQKEKSQKKDTLKTVCDRVKKSVDSYSYECGPIGQSKSFSSKSVKDIGLFKRTSLSKLDSPSPSCSQSSSSSKRRLQTSVEKRKKGRRRGHAARLAAAAATLLSSTPPLSLPINPSTTTSSNLHPTKSQRPAEKVVALPRGLKPHKHKKHHRRKQHKKHSSRSNFMDPSFLQELEKLIADFQRSCYIARIQQPSRLSEGTRLPSIFRVKRILKKRKGSERSKNSDRDSGPEADNTNPPVTPAPRDSRDKGSTGGKRRPKKGTLETPKGQRPEANNEQRLPLKKRHYHMSAAPNQQNALSSSPEVSLDISSCAEDKSPTSSTSSKASIASNASQGSKGNSSLCDTNMPSKVSVPSSVPNTVWEASVFPYSGRTISSPICSVNNRLPMASACAAKSSLPAAKDTVVMPATSSSPFSNDFRANEPSLLSKADSSDTFASVCGKSDSTFVRVPTPNVEKTYPLNTPLAVNCASRMYGTTQTYRGTSPTSSMRSALSTVSPKSLPSPGEPNTSCSTASKVSSSKSSSNVSMKPIASVTPNNSSLKSVADSSLVMKMVSSEVNSVREEGSNSSVPNLMANLSGNKNAALLSAISANFAAAQASSSKCNIVDGKVVRNSYDEAIEACISKYSSDVPSVTVAPRSVITTPKKRHRIEMQGKPGGAKGKESEVNVHSTTGNVGSQTMKKSNARTITPVPTVPEPAQPSPSPTPQAPSPKLPESGIFEPSSSSEHYVVNVSLPATPVKSVIAGLSKLKSAGISHKSPAAPPTLSESTAVDTSPLDLFSLTCHNLRQKKNILSLSTEGDPDIVVESDTQRGKSASPQLPTEVEIVSASKMELEAKIKAKIKSKAKHLEDAETSKLCSTSGSESEVKDEGRKSPEGSGDGAAELKEVRIHVEKLTNVNTHPQTEKEKSAKQLKSNSAVTKRRRKCNRTGFPVKRKKKKKESSPDDVKTENDRIKLERSCASTSESAQKSPNASEYPLPIIVPFKEEVFDNHVNIAKVEHKKDAVILKIEDCAQNPELPKDLKQETRSPPSALLNVVSNHQHDEMLMVPYTDRLPNKDKYMYAGFTKRGDANTSNKVRKPSKAVLRAMRAKFSENIPLPDLSTGSNKGSKSVPPTWSSDDSDDSVDDPYEFSETPPPGSIDSDEPVRIANVPEKTKSQVSASTEGKTKSQITGNYEGKGKPQKVGSIEGKLKSISPGNTESKLETKVIENVEERMQLDVSENSESKVHLLTTGSIEEKVKPSVTESVEEKVKQPVAESIEEKVKPQSNEQIIKPVNRSSRKRPKRDVKQSVPSSCDESVKTKCAKSERDGNSNSTASKTKSNTSDSRTRNKRKNESDDLPSQSESRNSRSSKRLRTVQKLDADSLDTDGDESVVAEPQTTSTGGTGDAASEDETPKVDLKDAKQPKWRKKYLPAGLFSDYFKLDEPRLVSDSKKGLQYKPEDHPHGLLPPPYHCGKWLRQRRVNFQLPYDLWWLHTHNKLPGRDIVPSWNYKKIRTNVYNNVKPSYVHEPQSCNCKTPENETNGCGDDCINRLVYTECSASLCSLNSLCSNQKIQRHEWAPGLEKFMTKEKGWGVRAKLPIKSGEFILEYVGEVVSDKVFKERMATIYTQDTHHYCLHLDGGLVIDGHRMGGDGRFVNHSCEPNCEMQKWSVNGLFRMALFALRDIESNEELGYDYNFSLFNAAEGQPCKCGSTQCRGVIGGKSQRVNVLPSTQNGSSSKVCVEDASEKKGSRKNKRKASRKNDKEQAAENMRQKKRVEAQRLSQLLTLNIRQMSHQQRSFVQEHHCFLLRNLEKVRRLKEKLRLATQRAESLTKPASSNVKQSDVFLTQLNALSIPRNVRTRRLAQAEDNPELARNARLACVLRDLYNAVVSAKDENGEALSAPFMTLPNKRKLPLYYVRIREPLDFSTVDQNINSGLYCTLEAFDQDICRILNNNLRFYGRTTNLGIASVRLKKVYLDAKKEAYPQLVDVLGETLPASFVAEKNPAEEEDVIRCICGLYRDEGMMIQCERCLVWQHCDCVKADSTFEHYLCEICQPRPVDLEIIMEPQPPHNPEGQTEYLTLLRSDLQIRQGDTVYVLRDVTEGEGESQAKVTYKTIKDPKYGDMDIFRVERLWKDEKGERFAYGHHYLRPHETYHEPTRKFYPNEVMRVPLYEIISLDLIWARCWVLDPMTYCKGRPIEAVEEHVYICEYRVDKSAHLFYKISKSQSRANLCLKSYAFDTFETRLKPVRTYTPHGPVPPLKPPRMRGRDEDCSSPKPMQQPASVAGEEEEMPLARVRDSAIAEKREKQRSNLNGILLRLLANQQCKQPLDMSYLLDPGRRPRKKPGALNS